MLDSNGSFDNPFFQDKKIVKIDCKWKDQEYTKDAFGFTHAEYVCSFILKENPEAEIILVPIVRKNKKSTVLDMIEGIELLIEEQVEVNCKVTKWMYNLIKENLSEKQLNNMKEEYERRYIRHGK